MQTTEKEYVNEFLGSRVDALSDAIFAIVMTLLVIEIRVPELHGAVSNSQLWQALLGISDLLLSYGLSFLVLFTFWVTQHYIISIYAKNVTRGLVYLNLPYLMAIALIPFSSHLLGTYPTVPLAIWVYGANVSLIGILEFIIFNYVRHSKEIDNHPISPENLHYGYIRATLPIIASVLAIALSVWNTRVSIIVFIIAITVLIFPRLIRRFDSQIISKILPCEHISD